jgi:hypothetical protein
MATPAEMVAIYLQAEADILAHGQSSAFQGRALTTADLPEVRKGRQEWEERAAAQARAQSGGSSLSVRTATFR